VRRAVAFLLILALSGCAGHRPTAAVAPTDAATDAGLGVVVGHAWDEEQRPLPDVAVTVAGRLEQSAATDGEGAFRLAGLEPGPHTLYFQKLGFETLARDVRVAPDAEATVDAVLLPLPLDFPYTRYERRDGYLGLEVGAPQYALHLGPYVDENERSTFKAPIERGLATVLSGVHWDASGPLSATRLEQALYFDKWFHARAAGEDPLVLRADQWAVKEPKNVTVTVGLPPSKLDEPARTLVVAYQQRFEFHLALHYHAPAPADATPLP
jgi:carboxypeptidase family protein